MLDTLHKLNQNKKIFEFIYYHIQQYTNKILCLIWFRIQTLKHVIIQSHNLMLDIVYNLHQIEIIIDIIYKHIYNKITQSDT